LRKIQEAKEKKQEEKIEELAHGSMDFMYKFAGKGINELEFKKK